MSALATPPGGWRYQEGNVIIIADSFQELVRSVSDHRLSNRIEVGNVQQDISVQIKEFYPTYTFQLNPVATIHGH